jgi:hypothetical protein
MASWCAICHFKVDASYVYFRKQKVHQRCLKTFKETHTLACSVCGSTEECNCKGYPTYLTKKQIRELQNKQQ